MDKRDLLKSVLQNFINDKPDDAKADFHQYLTLKSKEITGIGAPAVEAAANTDLSQTEGTDTSVANQGEQEVTPDATLTASE